MTLFKLEAVIFMFKKYRCTNLTAILFTIVGTLVFVSCEKVPQEKTEIITKNGLIFKQGEPNPYSGIIKDTVEGKIVEYAVIQGKKNGEFKTYFKNGNLEMVGQIKDNLNQGKWTYYYKSGQIESEGIFKDDLPDGNCRWFYENGNLREEGNYVKGNREGRWIMYDEKGKIKEKKTLEKNRVIDKK
jgi:antitoxin component YwqK of YwqJK toxin-antitoxin module